MVSEKSSLLEEGKVFLFDKPLYWTAFDLVNKIRIMIKNTLCLKNVKVGHAGTLDPLASGLMIICTGKATRKIDEYRDLDKEYVAGINLGATTPSFDLETEVNERFSVDHITDTLVLNTLSRFVGEHDQIPPLHSAKMINGKRAYEYARKGLHRELAPVKVVFRDLELLSFELPVVRIRMVCSKGTYVRSFARDFGLALGSGAYLSSLVRTSIGNYRLENAYSLDGFKNFLEDLKQI
jgi:tRNA pseudouridine55 synthase